MGVDPKAVTHGCLLHTASATVVAFVCSQLRCKRCDRTFSSSTGPYIDLTIGSGLANTSYAEKSWGGTEMFRCATSPCAVEFCQAPTTTTRTKSSPGPCRQQFVSNIYERGWRQGFSWAGFPGADTEFGYVLEYLKNQYGMTLSQDVAVPRRAGHSWHGPDVCCWAPLCYSCVHAGVSPDE
jgi:hypothetical protein